ncbi:C-C motif chemokine 4-like [Solea senegalensis]|uniref:C-C motif chemokine 4-like n=1 Tax=Solea senegalensis TaxID=28829 RepID=A0AAV6T7Q3_SOLSE|nr:C-C motif chemokine 4-like [Solea senegalensis]
MWTSLSLSRWIFLLPLTVIMFGSASHVDAAVPIINLSCCRSFRSSFVPKVKACYEQKPRHDCDFHAFLIITKRNKVLCVGPAAPWLQDKINKGGLHCPPVVSLG